MIIRLFRYLTNTKSINEDSKRKEYVLYVLLLGAIALSGGAVLSVFIDVLRQKESYSGIPLNLLVALSLIFLALFLFSKAGFYKLAAYIFITLYLIGAIYTSVSWGVDVPQSLLIYALVIVMSGILINTKVAFVITVFISGILLTLTYLLGSNVIQTLSYWSPKPLHLSDAVIYSFTLGIICIVSWLSNREIEKALKRARTSEEALQKERDLLEIKVEKRTQELQKIQLEKVMQIYRFSDLGKLAAGLFHDLVTPLNVVSLNLENLKEETTNDKSKNIKEIRRVLKRAIYSTKGIEKFVKNTRLQLQGQQTKSYFNLVQEIDNALEGLADKALKAEVKLDFSNRNDVYTFGNPFRFHQMVINLVSNAIDSYDKVGRKNNRVTHIKLFRQDNFIIFEVEDFGIGVPRNILPHIFDPFYTTKPIEEGIGIGLTICKDIAEKDFGGSITVKSQLKKGTIFRVQFPGKELYDAQEHI